jgi:hypothetical protein
MTPFRNSGWRYFDKFNEIMPTASARGSYAFSPMKAAAPGQLDDEEAAAGTASNTGIADGDAAMEVDKDGDGSTLISTTASKRKLSAFIVDNDNDDTITFNSGLPPSSTNTPTSSNLTSGRPSKRESIRSPSSAAGSSRSQLKASSHHSKVTSSLQSSNRSRGAKTSAKLSSFVHDMQGSINMLTATVRSSMESDPVMKVRQEAVRLLQTRDDGLSRKHKIALFHIFTDRHSVAQTYLAIEEDDLRRAWLQELCASVKGDEDDENV